MLTGIPDVASPDLLAAWEEFIVGLRMRKGFSEEAYERLRGALRACANAWKEQDSIPRLGANVLVDIFAATNASADLYDEVMRTKIQEMSYQLHDLVQECVGVKELG